jgi:hypothetical protein
MFSAFRNRELAALAPLLDLARGKTDMARRAWIDDLRRDAPVTMARIEAILAEEARSEPAVRVPATRFVATSNACVAP